jgi:PadR family transcriptional regulator, regulatory protein PadR
MAPRERLGELEELVLLAVLRLRGAAYGASLRRELATRTGRAPSVSTIYITLMRLEAKGLVASEVGPSAPPGGGRPRRVFEITPLGTSELRAARSARESLWEGMDDLAGPARSGGG